MSISEKMQKWHEFVIALEEERTKILVFQRELPLCLELVTQAIETYKKELSGTTTDCVAGNSDCSDQTSSGAPVLEEFIPIRRGAKLNVDDEDENNDEEHRWTNKRRKSAYSCSGNSSDKDDKRKSDWLRSAQLWKQPSDPSLTSDKNEEHNKRSGTEFGSNCGAFQPFQRNTSKTDNNGCNKPETALNRAVSSCPSSSAETVGSGGGTTRKEEKYIDQKRKQRRCWSPELHRRFLQALQQLGGSHVSTPKQIRELMKVDGLTNDEVKSHLQKYRLHTRRPTQTIATGHSSQPPQFVVVGGIWMPPANLNREVGNEVATKTVYAPVASTPMASKAQESDDIQLRVEEDDSAGEGDGGHCDSLSTSCSTGTSTSSPARSG